MLLICFNYNYFMGNIVFFVCIFNLAEGGGGGGGGENVF